MCEGTDVNMWSVTTVIRYYEGKLVIINHEAMLHVTVTGMRPVSGADQSRDFKTLSAGICNHKLNFHPETNGESGVNQILKATEDKKLKRNLKCFS